MNKHTFRKRSPRGQGLVEYAIIIALVAIVVVVIITFVGFAAKRNFGIVAGALGATHDETSGPGTHIEITSAQCLGSKSQNLMGIWILGRSNVAPSQLMGSTDLGYFTAPTNNSGVPGDDNPGDWRYNPLIPGSGIDLTRCPHSVVIQAADGTTAVAPVIAGMVN